ncbi:MAG: signal peptidase [Solirubrobacteraceae bacterium]|nr:signal peptidase [Solirubrobacteraceae bacterium]
MPSAHTALRSIDRAATFVCASVAVALIAAVAGSLAGYRLLVDISDSMRPALRAGDLLVTERVPAASVRRGDIVSLADVPRGGRLVTHRVVAISRTGSRIVLTTRGDANPATESWVKSSTTPVQRVATRVPALGRALAMLGAVGLPALLGSAAILLAVVLRRSRRTRA